MGATPGHEPNGTGIMFYDNLHKIMLSGDVLYPGRLYIHSFIEFRESIRRIWNFSQEHEIKAFLGSHIEIGKRGNHLIEYVTGTRYQPEEVTLPLFQSDVNEIYHFFFSTHNGVPMDSLKFRVIMNSVILHPK